MEIGLISLIVAKLNFNLTTTNFVKKQLILNNIGIFWMIFIRNIHVCRNLKGTPKLWYKHYNSLNIIKRNENLQIWKWTLKNFLGISLAKNISISEGQNFLRNNWYSLALLTEKKLENENSLYEFTNAQMARGIIIFL